MGDMADYFNEIGEAEMARPKELDDCDLAGKVCRCCGSAGFRWQKNEHGKWRLYDFRTAAIHICPVNPLRE
jgi:hypothetical protein